jgi:hypothetical protein
MSEYGVYEVDINYMICTMCNTEAFTWMAEVFACFYCGSTEYKFPMVAGTLTKGEEREAKAGDADEDHASTRRAGRKRKRKRKLVSSDEEAE